MIDKAYIQFSGNLPINPSAYNLLYGCKMLGIEVVPFHYHEKGKDQFSPQTKDENYPSLDRIELTPETLVHGWVCVVHEALEKLHIPKPNILDYPAELEEFLGRQVWETTLGEIRRSQKKVFIKPRHQQKAFTGHLSSGQVSDLLQTAFFDDDFEIWASEPIKFLSEYRVFVHQKQIIGISHYLGDCSIALTPDDINIIDRMIDCFQPAPVSYALDVGIIINKLRLVEINDAYSLGCYGLPPVLYAQMIIDRWKEMVSCLEKKI